MQADHTTTLTIRQRPKLYRENGVQRMVAMATRGRDGEYDVQIAYELLKGRALKGLVGGGQLIGYDLADGYYRVRDDGDDYLMEVRDGLMRRVSRAVVISALGADS